MEERWGPPPGDRYIDGDDFVIAGLELGNVLVADPAAARLRRRPGRHLPRPRAAAHAPLPGVLPVARPRLGRRRDRPPRQARHARVAARQDARALGRVRARRGARRHAARLPVRRQRPGRGRAGQAPRARRDRRPPRAADDARRDLRRAGRARGAAGRVRAARGARPVQAAGARARRSGRRSSAPTCRPTSASSERPDDVGDARRAHRRLPLRGQGHPDQGRPARARAARREGEQLRGLVAAILRLGRGDVAGLRTRGRRGVRARRARARGRARARPAPAARPSCSRASAGPSASAGDLVDRLEAAQMALLDALAARDWDARSVDAVCLDVLGAPRRRRRARAALRRRARSCRASCARRDELDNVLARAARPPRARRARRAARRAGASTCCRPGATSTPSTRARCRPSCRGRSGGASPTRCSSATAPRPASCRSMVGLVAWGTSAMRTQGDDVAEILALLGVRPTWHPESRRVTGHRGDPARGARPAADRRHRAHLRLLPRRLPAPRACCSTTRWRRSRRSTSRPTRTSSPRTRAPTPSAWPPSSASGPGGGRRCASSAPSRAPTAPGLLQLVDARDWRDDADIAAGLRGLGRLRLRPRARRRARRRRRCATASAASRSRSRTSTRASTTSSTPTTTTSTTAAWSRPCAR